tara:strand:- start:94 stop:402 length:309 start_codon:yes stop_codon:yes gene_type:complete
MQTDVIDYTAEVLSRRLLDYMNRGDYEEAQTLSALLEGYLDGLWNVTFKGGEPLFTLNDDTINLNDFKELREPEQLRFAWYEDRYGDEDDEWGFSEGPLDEQ